MEKNGHKHFIQSSLSLTTAHYGSKAFKSMHWWKKSLTHLPARSAALRSATLRSAPLHFDPLYCAPLRSGAPSRVRKW